jgi:hypothetical protein
MKTGSNQAVLFIFRGIQKNKIISFCLKWEFNGYNLQTNYLTGIQFWAYEMLNNSGTPYQMLSGYPKFVANIYNSFPTAIDGCYMSQKTNKVVFFMRWMYFWFSYEKLLVLIVLLIINLYQILLKNFQLLTD